MAMRFRYSYRKKAKLFANSGDPDQMPRSAASDLDLHCLPITRLGVSRLQWVKIHHDQKQKSSVYFMYYSFEKCFIFQQFPLHRRQFCDFTILKKYSLQFIQDIVIIFVLIK